MTSEFRHATSSAGLSSGRDDVSVMINETPSGVASALNLVAGSTGGGLSGKDSVAAAVIRDVLPTCESPTTHTLTAFPGFILSSLGALNFV